MSQTKVAVGMVDATGTPGSGNFLRGDSSWNTPDAGGFTIAAEQSTGSGTSVTFGSIPTGTKMIVIMIEGVSLTGATNIDVTIGDSGGLETSGYISGSTTHVSSASAISVSTAEFIMKGNDTSNVMHGTMTLTLKDASNFTWTESHLGHLRSDTTIVGGGTKSLSAELTQVSVTGGTFDAGSISIMYQ